MKKTTLALAIICASTTFAVFADTTITVAPPSTTAAPSVATTTTAAPPSTTWSVKTAKKPVATHSKSTSSGSVYESIKSGWNSFITLLTGPPTPSK